MSIFGSNELKNESTFPFQYNIIFETYLSNPLAPLLGEIVTCTHSLFCTKFNSKQFLFQPFFDKMYIFGSVESYFVFCMTDQNINF